MNDVIFTPVFRGTEYKYHQCSACQHHIKLDQSIFGGVDFGDKKDIKFCPHCGGPVVRFENNAIFETQIDFEPLYPFCELYREYKEKVKWKYYCAISEEQQLKIRDIIEFAKESGGLVKIAAQAVQEASFHSPSWQSLRKLEKKFGVKKQEK